MSQPVTNISWFPRGRIILLPNDRRVDDLLFQFKSSPQLQVSVFFCLISTKKKADWDSWYTFSFYYLLVSDNKYTPINTKRYVLNHHKILSGKVLMYQPLYHSNPLKCLALQFFRLFKEFTLDFHFCKVINDELFWKGIIFSFFLCC